MEFRDDLKAYLDGELSGPRADEVRKAIDADPDLAQEAQELTALSTTLRTTPQPQPYGLEQTLLALEAAKRRPARRSPWGWWFGLGLATAGCLAIGAVILRLPSGSEAERLDMVAMNDSAKSSATLTAPLEESKLKTFSDEKEAYSRSDLDKRAVADGAKGPAAGKAPTSKRSDPAPNIMGTRFRVNEAKERPTRQESTNGLSAKAEKISPKPVLTPLPDGNVAEWDKAPGAPPSTVTFAAAKPVELKVDSFEDAEVAIRELAASHDGLMVSDLEKKDSHLRMLVLEVPEDQADKILSKLKDLPAKLLDPKFKASRVQTGVAVGAASGAAAPPTARGGIGGGGGGFGGGAGAGPGGPGGGQGAQGGGVSGGQSQSPTQNNVQNLNQGKSQDQNLNRGANAESLQSIKARDQANVREQQQRKKQTRKISILLLPVKPEPPVPDPENP